MKSNKKTSDIHGLKEYLFMMEVLLLETRVIPPILRMEDASSFDSVAMDEEKLNPFHLFPIHGLYKFAQKGCGFWYFHFNLFVLIQFLVFCFYF